MRFIIMLALLAFPFAEIWLLITLSHYYGWWVLLYLVVVALLGLQLIIEEKLQLSGRIMQNLSQGGNPVKAMLGSARNIVAGIFLIIPGVITDILAVILLLLPVSKRNNPSHTQSHHQHEAANDDVIEGEFRREKE